MDVGTLLTVIGIVVALAAIAAGAWAAFRSAWPRRVLYIHQESAVPLIMTSHGLDDEIEVRHQGIKLDQPYVVTVVLTHRGDRDIEGDAFGGSPLELRLGVPIVKMLKFSSKARRRGVRTPKMEITPTAIHLGPALLTRWHQVTYVILVDGKPELRPVGDLANVVILEEEAPLPVSKRGTILLSLAIFATLFLAAGVFSGLAFHNNLLAMILTIISAVAASSGVIYGRSS